MVKNITFVFTLWIFTSWLSCAQSLSVKTSGMPWSVRMADSEMTRTPDASLLDFVSSPRWSYTNGLVCSALQQVWRKTGEQKYYDYGKAYADKMINADGTIKTYELDEYNIDKINPGKFLFTLLEQTGDQKYEKAIRLMRDQIRTHPRTSEGGFWHKKIYPNQMWLDGIYMGSPFLAQYAQVFNEPALFDEVALQIRLVDKHTYDPRTGLYYHAWDESKQQKWANPQTGTSPNFWGRAMGWFGMALVDVLDFFPADHPQRKEIIAVANKLAEGIVKYQDKNSGLWFQVVDQGTRKGNYLEASASVMYAYFLVKAARKNYIDKKYMERAKKAYEGVLSKLIRVEPNGMVDITSVCGVAGLGGNPYRDGSYEYYVNEIKRDNDPKAVGPFIMMAIEFETLNK